MIKEVDTIDVAKSVYEWPWFLKTSDLFSKFKLTRDDLKKKEQYKKRSILEKEIKQSENKKEYLKSIKLLPKRVKIDSTNILRAEQLTNKTNQFNLTTKRYSQEEILSVVKINTNLSFMVQLNDIYGDHGIVGLIILKELEKKYLLIDTFLMSCRVFGRYLENWILNEIFKIANDNNFKFIIGNYIETKKNAVVKNFFNSNNFQKLDDEILKKLKLSIDSKDNYFISDTSKKTIKFIDLYE